MALALFTWELWKNTRKGIKRNLRYLFSHWTWRCLEGVKSKSEVSRRHYSRPVLFYSCSLISWLIFFLFAVFWSFTFQAKAVSSNLGLHFLVLQNLCKIYYELFGQGKHHQRKFISLEKRVMGTSHALESAWQTMA